jgi:hypothetical protein
MRRSFARRQALQFLNVVLNPPPAPRTSRAQPVRVAA